MGLRHRVDTRVPEFEVTRVLPSLAAFLAIVAVAGDAPPRIHGVVSGLGPERETWIGVFSDPVAPGAEATSWMRARETASKSKCRMPWSSAWFPGSMRRDGSSTVQGFPSQQRRSGRPEARMP